MLSQKSGKYIISDMALRKDNKEYCVNEAILRKDEKNYLVYSGYTIEYTLMPASQSDNLTSNSIYYLPIFYDEKDRKIDYTKITIFLKNGNKTDNLSTYVKDIDRIKIHFKKETRRITAPRYIVELKRLTITRLTSMKNMFSDCSHLVSINTAGWTTHKITDMYGMFSGCSSLTSLDLSNWNVSNVTNMSYMFSRCELLSSLNVSEWDTSNVTNMNSMFYFNESLKSLDISNWNTGNVTTMKDMFKYCTLLNDLQLGNWNTEKVTNMSHMFQACSSLTSLDLSKWNISSVNNTSYMFAYNESLTNLDLSNWDTSNVTDCSDMFYNCDNLVEESWNYDGTNYSYFTLSEETTAYNDVFPWNYYYVEYDIAPTKDEKIFLSGSDDITYLPEISHGLGSVYITLTDGSIIRTTEIEAYRVKKIKIWYHPDVYSIRFRGEQCCEISAVYFIGHKKLTEMDHMFYNCTKLTRIDNILDWDMSQITDTSFMFYNCSSLLYIGLSNWQLQNVTDMSYMFYNCSKIGLYMYKWNVSSVTNMSHMFDGCSGLTTLKISNWKTNNVTDMSYMFKDCTSLSNLELGGWDTRSVTNVENMFLNVPEIDNTSDGWSYFGFNYIYFTITESESSYIAIFPWNVQSTLEYSLVSNDWDTPISTHLPQFNLLNQLKKYDISAIHSTTFTLNDGTTTNDLNTPIKDVSNVRIDYINSRLSTLKFYELELIDRIIELSTIGNMNDRAMTSATSTYVLTEMFYGCKNLVEINNISNWDTSSISAMASTFSGCSSLKNIDINGWNTENVTNMSHMFYGCSGLENIDISNWSTKSIASTGMIGVFEDCSSLTTLNTGNWDLYVKTLRRIFAGCHSLQSLDISGWNVDDSLQELTSMFDTCTNLETVIFPNWDTSNVVYMDGMFNNCSSLETLNLSSWDTSSLSDISSMFNRCYRLKSINISNWNISNLSTMAGMFEDCQSLSSLDLSNWKKGYDVACQDMFRHCYSLIDLNLSTWEVDSENATGMFSGIPADVNWHYNNTSYRSFYASEEATGFSQTKFDVFFPWTRLYTIEYTICPEHYSEITTIGSGTGFGEYDFFYFLPKIDGIMPTKAMVNFELKSGGTTNELNTIAQDVSKVTVMYPWYATDVKFKCGDNVYGKYICVKEILKMEIPRINDLSEMFKYCIYLESVNITDSSQLMQSTYQMFYYCKSLKSIDISKFYTYNVASKLDMFYKVPSSVNWNYNGTNYADFTLTESETSFNGTFPWNK